MNLDVEKHYLLACSYGPDSMALFHMLLSGGYRFSVAHVNYHLREEADSETEGLKRYCELHSVPLYVHSVKGIGKGNLEAKCREIRYSFFKEIYNQLKPDALLTAHQEDDLIETYYLQKRRKNLPIRYGIEEVTSLDHMLVIRPLLKYSKRDLLDYCMQNNIPFAIDKSNLSDEFQRNRIRHSIVEKMTREERNKCIDTIALENASIEEIEKHIDSLDLKQCETYKKLDEKTLCYALNRLIKSCGFNTYVSCGQCIDIQKEINSSKPNLAVPVRNRICFLKSYDKCCFSDESGAVLYSFLLEKPALLDTPYFHLDFLAPGKHHGIAPSDYPLTIRNANPHDKVRIKDYCCEVRRLFIDWKMPLFLRRSWPVFVNSGGTVLFVPRYQKHFVPSANCDFFVKQTEK